MTRHAQLARSILSAIILVLGLTFVNASAQSDEAASTSSTNSPDMGAFEKKFVAALTRTSSERRDNNATKMDCTWFFYDFSRLGDEIEPYKTFLVRKNFDVVEINQNHRHFVYTTLSYKYLLLSGYFGFSFGDKLVISFTTASPESSKITSFKVTLLNDVFDL